jgi:NPCBM/NEW2 domain
MGDGKELARSPLMTAGEAPYLLQAEVRGVRELTLRADGNGSVIWGDATIFP